MHTMPCVQFVYHPKFSWPWQQLLQPSLLRCLPASPDKNTSQQPKVAITLAPYSCYIHSQQQRQLLVHNSSYLPSPGAT